MNFIEEKLGAFPIGAIEWEQGVSLEVYIQGMKTNQVEMRRRNENVHLNESDSAQIRRLQRQVKIACLSEDWCIDCLMTLPIMNQIAAVAPAMDLRIFSRSHWPAMKDYYNRRGIMSIPTYAFLDPDFHEIATFVERPQLVYARLAEWKAAHPEIEEIRRSARISSEEKSARLAHFRTLLHVEMEKWYEENGQSAMVAEVVALLGVQA